MLRRKTLAEKLAKSLGSRLKTSPVRRETSTSQVFDRHDRRKCVNCIMPAARRFFCTKASSLSNPLSSNLARLSPDPSGNRRLLQCMNNSSHKLSRISVDLFVSRAPGLLVSSASPCQQIACYRTAARHRSSTAGRDSSNQSADKNAIKDGKESEPSPGEDKDSVKESGSIFQRFKQAYREHGKILIGVHLITSTVWFSSFFYAASIGIDVVPWLEHIGVSETLIKPFRSPNVGNIAMAYLMYKLATPARYTVTLGGTNMVIRYMRKTGRMEPVPEGHSLRELYKEGKTQMRTRRTHSKHSVKHHRRSK